MWVLIGLMVMTAVSSLMAATRKAQQRSGVESTACAVPRESDLRTMRLFFESGLYVVVPMQSKDDAGLQATLQKIVASQRTEGHGELLVATVDIAPRETLAQIAHLLRPQVRKGFELPGAEDWEQPGLVKLDEIGVECAQPASVLNVSTELALAA